VRAQSTSRHQFPTGISSIVAPRTLFLRRATALAASTADVGDMRRYRITHAESRLHSTKEANLRRRTGESRLCLCRCTRLSPNGISSSERSGSSQLQLLPISYQRAFLFSLNLVPKARMWSFEPIKFSVRYS
jgi:hypothetical protein